jgi:hypothetical protein
MSKPTTISIDGVDYVRADQQQKPAHNTDGKPYVVVRSRDSGAHAGYLIKENGNTLTLTQSRRLWYWDGAATLSQIAIDGVAKPNECKFPEALGEITIYGCCEKIAATEKAQKSIEGVKPWKQ